MNTDPQAQKSKKNKNKKYPEKISYIFPEILFLYFGMNAEQEGGKLDRFCPQPRQ